MQRTLFLRFLSVGAVIAAIVAVVLANRYSSRSVAGQLVKIGRTSTVDLYRVTFPAGVTEETLAPGRGYLITIPNDPAIASVPLDRIFSVNGTESVNYIGYQYLSSDASVEKLRRSQTLPSLTARFPGLFFASQQARDEDAIYGNTVANFETAQNQLMAATDTPAGILLRPNTQYYVLFHEATDVTVNIHPSVATSSATSSVAASTTTTTSSSVTTSTAASSLGSIATSSAPATSSWSIGASSSPASTSSTSSFGSAAISSLSGTSSSATVCGNGMVEGTEQCDPTGGAASDYCDSQCQLTIPIPLPN